MQNLIKALQIFLKYGNPEFPTICEHDTLYITEIHPSKVSEEDKKELKELGFHINETLDQFYSFKYGSA